MKLKYRDLERRDLIVGFKCEKMWVGEYAYGYDEYILTQDDIDDINMYLEDGADIRFSVGTAIELFRVLKKQD